jgi:hypothetical protein
VSVLGVKAAVGRATQRVQNFKKALWWASLPETQRRNVEHRRRVRREAAARRAYLQACIKVTVAIAARRQRLC